MGVVDDSVPTEKMAIRIRGLKNQFGAQVIHENLDLDVRRGEVLGVVGGSGTGKSVLLRTIIGLNRPREGRIDVLGHHAAALPPAERRRLEERWGVLFQDGAHLTDSRIRLSDSSGTSFSWYLRTALLPLMISIRSGISFPPLYGLVFYVFCSHTEYKAFPGPCDLE